MRKATTLVAVVSAMTLIAGPAGATGTMLDPFTQAELDDHWVPDRAAPTDGVISVTAFDRTHVARIGIDSGATDANTFRRTEGIKKTDDFGEAVQVDLYVDPAWQDTAVRAGLWVVGDDGTGGRDDLFGIVEFVNLEPSTSGQSAQGDHEGWRVWDTTTGWTNVTESFEYGEWVTLSITLDPEQGQYSYAVDGTEVGTATGGTQQIGEVFLNSYNYGLDAFPDLDTASYAAHWHAGVEDVDSKDQCKDGSWEAAGFKNQGQCIRFVNTGQDSR